MGRHLWWRAWRCRPTCIRTRHRGRRRGPPRLPSLLSTETACPPVGDGRTRASYYLETTSAALSRCGVHGVLVRARVGSPSGGSGVNFGGSSGSGGSGKDDGGDGALLGNAPAGQRSRVRRRASKRAFMFIDYCHASNFSITQRISTKRATTFWPSASSSPFST